MVKTAQLARAEVSRAQLNSLVRSGQIHQLRRGWWGASFANPNVAQAVRAGGVLTGPAALGVRGVWLPPNLGVHIRAAHADRVRADPGCSIHRMPNDIARPCARSCDDLSTALFVTMRDFSVETATIMTDSLLNRRMLEIEQVEHIANMVGPRGAAVLQRVDPHAESGTETLLRLWLRQHHLGYASQVIIPEVGRVDFLVGTSLVIEVDSRAHHTDAFAYANDRRRDRVLTSRGYAVLRFTYEDVMLQMDEIGQIILKMVREGRHLRRVSR